MGGLLSKTSCSFGDSFWCFLLMYCVLLVENVWFWPDAYTWTCFWQKSAFALPATSSKTCQIHSHVNFFVGSKINFWLLVKDNLLFIGCLVPRPHFSSWPKHFGSRGPCENVKMFPARLSRIRHWNDLTERDWENAVQGLGKFIGCLCISTEAIKHSSLGGVK